jgi:hypothetical protein
MFLPFGEVLMSSVARDRTGAPAGGPRSHPGHGYVRMRSLNDALSAVSALNGSPTDRGPLIVSVASDEEPPEQMVVQLQALQQQVAQLMAQTAHQARILAQTQMVVLIDRSTCPGIVSFTTYLLPSMPLAPPTTNLPVPLQPLSPPSTRPSQILQTFPFSLDHRPLFVKTCNSDAKSRINKRRSYLKRCQ